jgi:hypothetical protein
MHAEIPELPTEFVRWVMQGITFVNCKKAVSELGIRQVRRAEGQRFTGLQSIQDQSNILYDCILVDTTVEPFNDDGIFLESNFADLGRVFGPTVLDIPDCIRPTPSNVSNAQTKLAYTLRNTFPPSDPEPVPSYIEPTGTDEEKLLRLLAERGFKTQ